jgi:hypothetical protein
VFGDLLNDLNHPGAMTNSYILAGDCATDSNIATVEGGSKLLIHLPCPSPDLSPQQSNVLLKG